MFTFLDPHTGVAFDGNPPYTFWFEGGQSINLNYVLSICCYTDSRRLKIAINSDLFSILAMDQLIPQHERIEMNKKLYIDLDELKCKSYTSKGYSFNGNYVHMFYIIANSKDVGEFVEEFTIDGDTYRVGADFYAMNEILQSNMENFEISLPESIQRAIYEVNVHEESNDNITLNRKHKELLMNYWDIVANKGSYESLINSLKWFEWRDLVRIEEAWKKLEPHQEIFQLKDLRTQIDDVLQSQLNGLTKTTYIGLYYALQHIEVDDKGRVVYKDTYDPDPQNMDNRIFAGQITANSPDITKPFAYNMTVKLGDPANPNMMQTAVAPHQNIYPDHPNKMIKEEVPVLHPVVSLWNNIDLCIKMTLLGNFYSTFFMPVHLDLIHSTIESWVYSNVIKLLNVSQNMRVDLIDNTKTFELYYEYK